jgi:hypothetical protein
VNKQISEQQILDECGVSAGTRLNTLRGAWTLTPRKAWIERECHLYIVFDHEGPEAGSVTLHLDPSNLTREHVLGMLRDYFAHDPLPPEGARVF